MTSRMQDSEAISKSKINKNHGWFLPQKKIITFETGKKSKLLDFSEVKL
jgi:hypothetical protein